MKCKEQNEPNKMGMLKKSETHFKIFPCKNEQFTILAPKSINKQMKKIVTSLFLLSVFILTFAGVSPKQGSNANANCDVKALKKEGISQLSPYYYSSSKVTSIN